MRSLLYRGRTFTAKIRTSKNLLLLARACNTKRDCSIYVAPRSKGMCQCRTHFHFVDTVKWLCLPHTCEQEITHITMLQGCLLVGGTNEKALLKYSLIYSI